MLKGDMLKESSKSERRLIIQNKVLDGKKLRFEKGKDFLEGGNVRLSRPGFERMVVDVAMVQDDDEVFVAVKGGNGKDQPLSILSDGQFGLGWRQG